MKIYTLTQLGSRLARSTNNPNTSNWRVVHYLDGMGHGTSDQIADHIGVPNDELAGSLSLLRRKGVIKEISGGV